tara:strand:+ start:1346 stop:1963 length:618 start_codon:yes stop_codon:yes gene_type:complete
MAQTPLTNAFISLNDIINNFIISYTGPGKLIPDSNRTEVVFHARRCLQEFAYETLKSQFNDTFLAIATLGVLRYTQPTDSVSIINIKRAAISGAGGIPTILMEEIPNGAPALNQYVVNYDTKVITFNVGLDDFNVSYTYLSNALTTDESAAIPKLAEEALYACMVYAILANRENTNPGVLQRLLIEKIDKLERSKSRLIFTNFSS